MAETTTTEVVYYKGALQGLSDNGEQVPPIIVIGVPDDDGGGGTGKRYWPVRSVCDVLGIKPNNQVERLKLDGDFARHLRTDLKLPTARGARLAVWIDEEALGGWLSNIQSQRVKPEMQDRIRRFRKAVWLFAGAVATGALQPVPPALAAPEAPQKLTLEEAYRLAEDAHNYAAFVEQRQTHYERHTPVPVYVVDEADLDGDEAGIVRVPFTCDRCGATHVLRLRLRAAISPEVLGIDDEED